MNKILITGASGFVGGFLVEEALKRDFDVYAAVRKTSNRQYLTDERINFLEVDFKQPDQLETDLVLHQFNYIIHNAGAIKAKNLDEFVEVNCSYLESMVNILMAKKMIPSKFIYISSLAALGPADFRKDKIVKDSSEPSPITDYGKSKLLAERFLFNLKHSFPFVIIRPSIVYGPREKELFTVFKLTKSGISSTAGSKPQLLSFIYVKDLCRLIMDALASNHKRKAYLVSDGKTYSNIEFNEIIKQALNKKTIQVKVPIAILRILASVNEKISGILGKSTIFNRDKINEIKCQSWAIDTSGIKEDFNFAPSYHLEKGVRLTAKWYEENNWL